MDIQIRKDQASWAYISIYHDISFPPQILAKQPGCKRERQAADWRKRLCRRGLEHHTMGWIRKSQSLKVMATFQDPLVWILWFKSIWKAGRFHPVWRGRVWAKHNGALQCYPRPSTYTLIYPKNQFTEANLGRYAIVSTFGIPKSQWSIHVLIFCELSDCHIWASPILRQIHCQSHLSYNLWQASGRE